SGTGGFGPSPGAVRRPCLRRASATSTSALVGGVRFARGAGLEQRLEVAEHPAPAPASALVLHAAGDDHRQLRRPFELVCHRQLRDAAPPSSISYVRRVNPSAAISLSMSMRHV